MSKQKDMGFKLATAESTEVTRTFTSVIDNMKSNNVSDLAIQKVQRIREITKQSKATTFELMKNLHEIFDNVNLLKSMGYGKNDFCLMCSDLFGLSKDVSSKYANSGAFVIEENGNYMTPFAHVDELGFVTDITPTALIEMTFPKKLNDKGITLEIFSNFWNDYLHECGKIPTAKQIRDFKKATMQILEKHENALENGFAGVVALLEVSEETPKAEESKKAEKSKAEEPKAEEPKKAVESTQQNDSADFDIAVNEFDLVEIVEMLKDKADEIANIEPKQLYDMFGTDLMELFEKAIASKVQTTKKSK